MRLRRLGAPLVFCVALTLGMLVHAPAWLPDHVLAFISQDKIRLQATTGSFWRGAGVLMFRRSVGEYTPALAVGWTVSFNPKSLRLEMEIAERSHPMARVTLGLNGFDLQTHHVLVPAQLVVAAIEHPVARFGWQGALYLKPGHLRCDWVGACQGMLRLEWHQVSTDFLPQLVMGDYRFDIGITPDTQRFSVATLQGLVALEGGGVAGDNTRLRVDLIASGPPELIDRMPDMFHGHAQATGQAGRVRLVFN